MITSPPSVSFLCSAYRTEDTIVETIESVLAQTRSDWQLVVCDNGMSEAIAQIVEPYTVDPRIVLVRQENQLAVGGVNAAGAVASGDHVAILHSDDLVLPTFVERLVPLMDELPDTAALAPDAFFLGPLGIRQATYRGPVPDRFRVGAPVGLLELVDNWVPYYTALVRREAWEAVGGLRAGIPHVEDMGLWVDLMAHGYVVRCVEEPLAVYREDEDSDSRGARGVEVMRDSWEKLMTAAVASHGDAEARAALERALVDGRHVLATVRARRLLLEGDADGARDAARRALELRSDLRTRAMVASLAVSPALVRTAYRSKKGLERRLRRLAPHRSVAEVSREAVGRDA